MHPRFEELLTSSGLARIASQLADATLPAVGMSLEPKSAAQPIAASKLGGRPDLPEDFVWPTNKDRLLDFVLQLNLGDLEDYDSKFHLPKSGLLSFFYDLEDQPWGFDPANLEGFRVVYSRDLGSLRSYDPPDKKLSLSECAIRFYSMLTLPHFGSRAAERLLKEVQLNAEEEYSYYEFPSEVERLYFPSCRGRNHHLFGHSANVQEDMQLEAQLVTNGLYCGDSSGYEDPRRKTLESGADDWLLLLQLDSDNVANIVWGDGGMLYYWIHRDDLVSQKFENVWMTMQCY